MPSEMILAPDAPQAGFNFSNALRNAVLESKGMGLPTAKKTGTTIAGCIFKDGVILAADSRATSGSIIADPDCKKIYALAPNMFAAGAGTAADMEQVTASVSAQLELHRLNTGRVVPVAAASRIIKQHLFKYQGHVSAYLIVGGVDATGPRLVEVHAAGSSMTVPFTTTGSGCLAAMSVLETQWRRDMDEEDAKRMMKEAIDAGILNDLGSGSTVNMVVVKKDSAEYLRHFFKSQVKGERIIIPPGQKAEAIEPRRMGTYRYKKGTTAVLSTRVIPIEVESTIVHRLGGEAMETS